MKITAKNIFHSAAFIVALATLLLITSVMVKPRSMSQGNVLDDPLIGGIMSKREFDRRHFSRRQRILQCIHTPEHLERERSQLICLRLNAAKALLFIQAAVNDL